MKKIILNAEDMPTVMELTHAVSRLMKDYRLLKKIRGSQDIEEPDSMYKVASFLEMLIKREKRNLPKDKSKIDNSMDIMIDMVALHLLDMEDWELSRTVEETKLGKVFKGKT